MRVRGSITSQLLVAFCVVAVLIGAAAGAGYLAVTRQDAAQKQVTGRYAVLQHAEDGLEADFSTADFSVLFFAATRQGNYLWPLGPAQAQFAQNLAVLRRHATPGVRGLVAVQARTGGAWFTLAPKIVAARAGDRQVRALLAQSQGLATNFIAANTATQDLLRQDIGQLNATSKRALGTGLAWGAAALAVALLLVLVSSLSTLSTITRPLRVLTAAVRRLTAGDDAARAAVAGSAEVREVARTVNSLADESDRLRAQEAQANWLRAMAREAGLRIRDHLVASEVLNEARAALEQNLDADIVYLRLLEDGQLNHPIGRPPGWSFPSETIQQLPPELVDYLRDRFRAQSSLVLQDMQGQEHTGIPREFLETLRRAGVACQVGTPFGAGADMLGLIVAQRLHPGRPWTAAEVDAVESIAADLGRGLNQARLYEAEGRLVEELTTLDRTRSEFFATVSHELRAPLSSIFGYVELLGEGQGGRATPQGQQMLNSIDRNAGLLRDLIEDLFTLAKLESQSPATGMCPVNLAQVITETVQAVRPSVTAARLTLTVSPPVGALVVDGEPSQLDRLLINLLSNAVKFTPGGGRIRVSAATTGQWAVIRVADNGIGIPEHDQKQLFTRFFRAANATARSIPGTGLGLAIIHTIVANHGGEIGLDSQEGTGTTVTVRLPLAAPTAS